MGTLEVKATDLKVKYLGFRELKPNGRRDSTLEADIIPGAAILVRSNGINSRPVVVQYGILDGKVDPEKLPPVACLVQGEAIRVIYPVSYNYNPQGGTFNRVYAEPEFR